jgi:hypothetical protein
MNLLRSTVSVWYNITMNNDKLLKSLESLYSDLLWMDSELDSELNKGPNYWKDKDPAKYAKMLGKLSRDRKTVGHKERATQQVLQARRRENGGSGTTAGQHGHKGHAKGHDKSKTSSAVSKYSKGEKKAGEKMSLDRKNNNKGYESGNVKLAPQRLNRGDENNKKKKEWYKKHKK